MQNILAINAHLKYVEFLLYIFDKASDEMTLGEIKKAFQEKFKTQHPLLNQNFGIYRLLPLILMKEEYKKQRKELSGDIEKIKIIRDAISHHNFSIDSSYDEFISFLHKVENDFYTKGSSHD